MSASQKENKERTFPLDMVRWWEKKRWIYNVILVAGTTIILISLWDDIGQFTTTNEVLYEAFWRIIWCNVLYTGGWAAGILRHYYLTAHPLSNTGRWLVFAFGTFFTLLIVETRLTALVYPFILD